MNMVFSWREMTNSTDKIKTLCKAMDGDDDDDNAIFFSFVYVLTRVACGLHLRFSLVIITHVNSLKLLVNHTSYEWEKRKTQKSHTTCKQFDER